VEIPAAARGGYRCGQEQYSLRGPQSADNGESPNPQHIFAWAIDVQASDKNFPGAFQEQKQGQAYCCQARPVARHVLVTPKRLELVSGSFESRFR
jgi:hypothetical protein